MGKLPNIILFFVLIIITSCASKSKILYVQNLDLSQSYDYEYSEHKLKIDDILKIDIKSDDPEINLSYDGYLSNNSVNQRENLIFSGYKVDANGNIEYNKVGKINVLGLTITELKLRLSKLLIDYGLLTNPVIDIKLINASFTILGEVNNPGRYNFDENNINILQAIGMAGDLTINGKRNEITVIRESLGSKQFFQIDLTKDEFLSNNYQIFSGDIVIVKPNSSRVKNAGIIGNSGTLLSLLSFILSSIIVISN